MTDRSVLADAFLASTRWAKARRSPLAGDASNRRYERLNMPETGETAVLMDAPPEKGEDGDRSESGGGAAASAAARAGSADCRECHFRRTAWRRGRVELSGGDVS